MKKNIKVGLFGFGVVGEGFYNLLSATKDEYEIVKICVKNLEKSRSIPPHKFINQAENIIDDEEIDVVVELINDADTAYKIVKSSLLQGKHVVSANKKMISRHMEELTSLARSKNVNFLYEAAVGGSIPILRNLDNYYCHDEVQSIAGIINGSTNYILDLMTNENESLSEALLKAQDLGFAESDPTQDIEGFDASSKLKILVKKAFGRSLTDDEIILKGIPSIRLEDIHFADQYGLKIKLIARAEKINDQISAAILPQFVGADSEFYNVNGEFNAITLNSKLSGNQTLKGKGAGRYPTALAVVADLKEITDTSFRLEQEENYFNIAERDYIVYLSFPKNWGIEADSFAEVLRENEVNGLHQWLVRINAESLRTAEWINDPSVSVINFDPNDSIIINEIISTQLSIPVER